MHTLKVSLSAFFADYRSKAIITINENFKFVSDVEEKISKIFGIQNFYLVSEDQFLPSGESIQVLKECCTVSVLPKRNREIMLLDQEFYLHSQISESVDETKLDAEQKIIKEKKKKKRKKKKNDDAEIPDSCDIEELPYTSTPHIRVDKRKHNEEPSENSKKKRKKVENQSRKLDSIQDNVFQSNCSEEEPEIHHVQTTSAEAETNKHTRNITVMALESSSSESDNKKFIKKKRVSWSTAPLEKTTNHVKIQIVPVEVHENNSSTFSNEAFKNSINNNATYDDTTNNSNVAQENEHKNNNKIESSQPINNESNCEIEISKIYPNINDDNTSQNVEETENKTECDGSTQLISQNKSYSSETQENHEVSKKKELDIQNWRKNVQEKLSQISDQKKKMKEVQGVSYFMKLCNWSVPATSESAQEAKSNQETPESIQEIPDTNENASELNHECPADVEEIEIYSTDTASMSSFSALSTDQLLTIRSSTDRPKRKRVRKRKKKERQPTPMLTVQTNFKPIITNCKPKLHLHFDDSEVCETSNGNHVNGHLTLSSNNDSSEIVILQDIPLKSEKKCVEVDSSEVMLVSENNLENAKAELLKRVESLQLNSFTENKKNNQIV